jgi:hypothetical protein
MKRVALIVGIALIVGGLFASGSVKLTTAWGGGTDFKLKLDAGYQWKFDLLQGDGPLFEGNNLKVKASGGLSPVGASGFVDLILTPIAVAEISAGGGAGVGWDFPLLGIEGIRIGSIGSGLTSDQFNGAFYTGRAGLALQFDTGAILSGEWSSVLMRTYHELNYAGYSNANSSQWWEFETGGAMVNGFNYKGEYILAYQMPLVVNLVGAQVETYVYNTLDSGRSPLFIDVSGLANFTLTDQISLLAVLQFTNYKKVDTSTSELAKQAGFGFKRIAAIATYSF